MTEVSSGDTRALRIQLDRALDELQEANETLDAIRNGDVDAVVVGGPDGQIIYTLENADRPYRVLVEQMKEGALTVAADGVVLFSNQSFARLIGRRSADILGSNLFDYVAGPSPLKSMLATDNANFSTEVTLTGARGRAIPANISVVELRVEDGGQRMLCAIITDLTQNYVRMQEVAEANARTASERHERSHAEERLAIALDAADMANWEFSAEDGRFRQSPQCEAIFGYAEPQPSWTPAMILDHIVAEDRDAVAAAFAAAKEKGHIEFEKRIRRASDGKTRWIFVKGRALNDRKAATHLAGIVLDVTDRRMVEEQLRQAQKMEAVGQLTGGIAHDFNNLLMIIGGSLETFARRYPLDEKGRKLIDAAQIGVARGAKLNHQLLTFARRQTMEVETVCVNDLLPTFGTLLDRAMGEAVRVRIEKGTDLWHCSTDPHQLETAILNLAINARDAMGEEGTLKLVTRNATLTAEEAAPWEGRAGEYVVTSVADTGAGMMPDIIERVFEPFFTTKGVGRGTGLGLSQVYGFARQSSGFVSIASEVGAGTTVSIYLPRTTAPSSARPAARPVIEGEAFHGRILLVEDDSEVRAAAMAMLDELGYVVREASGGKSALAALDRDADIDLLFSDVIMSTGMTGIELAREVRLKYPGLPVLLTSGYTAQNVVPNALNQDLPLLRKPYTIADLAAALAGVMRARSPST